MPYSHNRDLAIGRTEALKNHIQQLYRFAEGVISTDYEPEDWAGLRRYVEASNLTHREEILALIASDMEPDAKEAKIRRTYPEEYRFLLQNCYPALRHTDYRIDYTIRSFSDVEEIRRLIRTQPQKLNLNEFFLAARARSGFGGVRLDFRDRPRTCIPTTRRPTSMRPTRRSGAAI